jgi:hypothetical protein
MFEIELNGDLPMNAKVDSLSKTVSSGIAQAQDKANDTLDSAKRTMDHTIDRGKELASDAASTANDALRSARHASSELAESASGLASELQAMTPKESVDYGNRCGGDRCSNGDDGKRFSLSEGPSDHPSSHKEGSRSPLPFFMSLAIFIISPLIPPQLWNSLSAKELVLVTEAKKECFCGQKSEPLARSAGASRERSAYPAAARSAG